MTRKTLAHILASASLMALAAGSAWAGSYEKTATGIVVRPDTGSAKEIRLRNPTLPAFLDEVVISDLRLGGASVDLSIRRHGDDVSVQLIRSHGEVRVSAVYA